MASTYGSIKYGAPATYGAPSPADTTLRWSFLVNWTGDGYTGENEAQRMSDLQVVRGRDNWLSKDGIDPYKPGVVTAVFDNDDRRYDPWNTSSPLYPNVRTGKFVRCLVKNGSAGLNYNVMLGQISDIQVYNRGMRRFARIVVKDGLEFLNGQPVKMEKRENFTYGELVELTLDAVGVPSEWTYSSNHNGNVILFHWAGGDASALDVIGQLEKAELGAVRHTRTGTFLWADRDEAVGSTTVITEDQILRDFTIGQPWEAVVNNAVVNVNPVTSHNITDVLWSISNPPIAIPFSFDPADGYSVKINFTHPTLSIPVVGDNIEPWPNYLTDYMFNDNPASSTPLVFQFPLEISLTNISDTADLLLSFTFNAGYSTGYLWELDVIGDAIYPDPAYSVEANDVTSQNEYGKKTVMLSSPMMQRETIARLIADGLVANLAAPIPAPIIQLENRPTIQFALDLYHNAINLQLDSIELDETYRIGRIEHRWGNENGQKVVTQFNLEPLLSW